VTTEENQKAVEMIRVDLEERVDAMRKMGRAWKRND
jgi:hypothetical protein